MTSGEDVVKKSCLYDKHIALTDKSRLAAFAGYLMPLWYSSISDEHRAVRETAGLFDCTHMGVLQCQGPHAEPFLEAITTNKVARLAVGAAQYSFFLDEQGKVLDDIIVYKRNDDVFMIVVNAANEAKIKNWLESLQAGQSIEGDFVVPAKPEILDLRDAGVGAAGRVDVALQGPASLELLISLVDDEAAKVQLKELKSFRFIETKINGADVILSRTGYTGAKMGFEIFVHSDQAGDIWDLILSRGESLSVKPCGLGSRDSLRIEGGLPLYGHELAGTFELSPYEAGYGWAVKLDKGPFIGRAGITKTSESYDHVITRLELPGKRGVRPVRENDAILNENGRCIGWVISCAKVDEQQIALAYMGRESFVEDQSVGVYYVARNPRHIEQGRLERVAIDQKVDGDIIGKIITRFEKY